MNSILEGRRERRLWERYPARGMAASLAWHRGTGREVGRGHLLDIGGGGAALVCDVPPPADVPVWLWIGAGAPSYVGIEPVEARLVRVSDAPSGEKIFHLQFVAPCPMGVFELAINGAG